MIIGPDTPYEGGFYFFDINFTPFNIQCNLLKLQFCTLNPYVRFNLNLYKCGKSLPILGTWSGLNVMNLKKFLLIYSLL